MLLEANDSSLTNIWSPFPGKHQTYFLLHDISRFGKAGVYQSLCGECEYPNSSSSSEATYASDSVAIAVHMALELLSFSGIPFSTNMLHDAKASVHYKALHYTLYAITRSKIFLWRLEMSGAVEPIMCLSFGSAGIIYGLNNQLDSTFQAPLSS